MAEKKITFPVEATHIMMFRRSIGDYSVPDTGLENAAAPPTFPRAVAQFDPNYFLRPRPGVPWSTGRAAPSARARIRRSTSHGTRCVPSR